MSGRAFLHGGDPTLYTSVWLTGQRSATTQRRRRCLPETTAHPARMLPAIAQSIRVKADRILLDMETRKIDGLAAMDELSALVREKAEAKKQADDSGLSSVGFAVFWTLGHESNAAAAGFDPMTAAREIETVLAKFPTWQENSEERRRLRAQLYKPLLALGKDERADAIDKIMQVLEQAS